MHNLGAVADPISSIYTLVFFSSFFFLLHETVLKRGGDLLPKSEGEIALNSKLDAVVHFSPTIFHSQLHHT